MFDSLSSHCDAPSSPAFEDRFSGSLAPVYSRAQAIEDGRLMDVSSLARQVGFKDAVALTHHVYDHCLGVDSTGAKELEDRHLRLLNLLLSAVWAMRAQSHRRLRKIAFTVLWVPPGGCEHDARSAELQIIAGPGDRGETVLTILSVDED